MVKILMILGLLYMGYRLVKPPRLENKRGEDEQNDVIEDVDYEEID